MTPAPHLAPPSSPEASSSPAPTAASTPLPAARLMAHAAAWLLLLGLLTGGYVAAAMTGKVPADPHTALAAHIGALLGTFTLLGVAWSLPMLRYGSVGQKRLAWLFIVPVYANWAVTSVKALLHVSGVDYTGQGGNDAVFITLNITVVVPVLIAAAAWVYGFRRPS